jgi:hypothetical protein
VTLLLWSRFVLLAALAAMVTLIGWAAWKGRA